MATTKGKGKLPLGRWPVRSLRLLVGIKANKPGGTQRCMTEEFKKVYNEGTLGAKAGFDKQKNAPTGKFSREQVKRAMLMALNTCAIRRGKSGLSDETKRAWSINGGGGGNP